MRGPTSSKRVPAKPTMPGPRSPRGDLRRTATRTTGRSPAGPARHGRSAHTVRSVTPSLKTASFLSKRRPGTLSCLKPPRKLTAHTGRCAVCKPGSTRSRLTSATPTSTLGITDISACRRAIRGAAAVLQPMQRLSALTGAAHTRTRRHSRTGRRTACLLLHRSSSRTGVPRQA
jgi:hypothetical protein